MLLRYHSLLYAYNGASFLRLRGTDAFDFCSSRSIRERNEVFVCHTSQKAGESNFVEVKGVERSVAESPRRQSTSCPKDANNIP